MVSVSVSCTSKEMGWGGRIWSQVRKELGKYLYKFSSNLFASRRRKSSPDGEESMDCDHKDELLMDTMDEHMAAMVLTSLSCSPVSPQFPGSFTDKAPFPGILDKGEQSCD